eukprot:650716-Pyramimonas_sp.AAC.2
MVSIVEGFVEVSLSDRPGPGNAWYAKVVHSNGERFVVCDKQNKKFRQFVKDGYDMLGELVRLREVATEKLLEAAFAAADPLGDARHPGVDGGAAKRPRKEMVDDVEKIVQLEVPLEDGSIHHVKVMVSAIPRGKLAIQLNQDNMLLLLKTPKHEPAEMPIVDPVINSQVVKWSRYRSSVVTHYFDAGSMTWKQKSMKVKATPIRADFDQQVAKLVVVLETFHREHHAASLFDQQH